MSTYRVPRAAFNSQFEQAVTASGEMITRVTVEWDPLLAHSGGISIDDVTLDSTIDDLVSAYIVTTEPSHPNEEQAKLLARWAISADNEGTSTQVSHT